MINKSEQPLPQDETRATEPLVSTPDEECLSKTDATDAVEGCAQVTEEIFTSMPEELCEEEASVPASEPSIQPECLPTVTQTGGFLSGSIVLRTSHLLIGALAVVLLVIGGIFLGMWISMSQIDHEIDPNAKDYGDLYVGPAEVTPGNLSAPGYDKVTFRAGERNVQIVLPNPEVNPCYFRFSLVLPDTNETLYRSGLVPPGKAITDVTLSRPLEKGTYRLEIVIEAASLEDRSAMNGLTMEVVLTVQ